MSEITKWKMKSKYLLIICILLISLIPLSSGDLLSINSAGSNEFIISGGAEQIEGIFFGYNPSEEEETPSGGGGSGSTSSNISKQILCDKLYIFIVSNTDNQSVLNYNQSALSTLASLIHNATGSNIEINSLVYYIKNFEKECNKTLPKPSKFKITGDIVLVIPSGRVNCSKLALNRSLNMPPFSFDMDYYLGNWNWNLGKTSEGSVNFWIYIFAFKCDYTESAVIIGLKTWWILMIFASIFYLIILVFFAAGLKFAVTFTKRIFMNIHLRFKYRKK